MRSVDYSRLWLPYTTAFLGFILVALWTPIISFSQEQLLNGTNSSNASSQGSGKVVILTFDDGWQSQIDNAKPVLDRYGFKGTFFITCNYIDKDKSRMTWDGVASLEKEGHDIQAHTMSHKNLNKLNAQDLEYEVGDSKKCLENHGINSTIMATPYNEGWNNSTVIKKIAKYYDLARNGNADIMFLRCDKWGPGQTDCRTFYDNGTLTFANKYSIRAWSHNYYDNKYQHNKTEIFDEFVKTINDQARFRNVNGTASAVPIIIYHNIDNTKNPYTTSIELFESEMKYLQDNGFKVITMDDLRYDNKTNYLYLDPSR